MTPPLRCGPALRGHFPPHPPMGSPARWDTAVTLLFVVQLTRRANYRAQHLRELAFREEQQQAHIEAEMEAEVSPTGEAQGDPTLVGLVRARDPTRGTVLTLTCGGSKTSPRTTSLRKRNANGSRRTRKQLRPVPGDSPQHQE
jgi:hypothetical protein